MKKLNQKTMSSKKAQSFSLLEILVSLSILVLVSALLGVKVIDLIGEHRFTSSVQAFADDLKQLQVLSVSHGSDCAIYLYRKKGAYYYECVSEADLKVGPLFSNHLLKGVSCVSIDQKKQERITLTISSTGRIDPAIAFGLHSEEIEMSDRDLWIDLRQPLIIAIATEKPGLIETPPMPLSPKNHPVIDK